MKNPKRKISRKARCKSEPQVRCIELVLPQGASIPEYHRIELPCGFAFASVTKDIKPETIKALDEMARAAIKQITAGKLRQNGELSDAAPKISKP